MSGRNLPLYCTLTLIAMQGHQAKQRQKDDEPGYSSILLHGVWDRMGVNTNIMLLLLLAIRQITNILQIDKAGEKVLLSDNCY